MKNENSKFNGSTKKGDVQNAISGVTHASDSSRQKLEIRELYLSHLKKHLLSEQHFWTPDFMAELWWIMKQDGSYPIYEPFIRSFETFLVETLSHDLCAFNWCIQKGINPDADMYLYGEMQVSETYESLQMSIKDIAILSKEFRAKYPSTEDSRLKLLMCRLRTLLPKACDMPEW